jgi:hypothetical protein
MNKWFESKNIANYAKTALLQAQKRIDQVLDIKEDEILGNTRTTENTESIEDQKARISSSSTSSIKSEEASTTTNETESFFSSFLNQTLDLNTSNTKKDEERKWSSSLLNVTDNISLANSFHSATSSDTTATQKLSNQSEEYEESTNSASSTTTLDDKLVKQKTNKLASKSSLKKEQEKQEWIQNFVDSSTDNSFQKASKDIPKDLVLNAPEKQETQPQASTNNELDVVSEANSPIQIIESEALKSEMAAEFNANEAEEKREKLVASSHTDIDFVKVDGNGSSGSGSSTEEGLETCASSDIEVLSLPSNSGDQLLAIRKGSGKNSSLTLAANKQAHVNKLHSNIKLIKSPPPPLIENNPSNQLDSQSSNSNPNLKHVLDAREAHILKLNKQNVKLQEENDNILNEIEKLKVELTDKCFFYQRTANELGQKYEQANNERDTLKKENHDLKRDLNEIKSLLKEKEEQHEQLVQEGLKLSKQELNQSNIIKKLRAKEKETEEVLNNLR